MQETFQSPSTGIGPNRYLRSDKLFVMLGVAFALHVLFLIIAELLPEDEIKEVPVRALNLKLGDAERGLGMRRVQRFTPPPQAVPNAPAPKAEPTPKATPAAKPAPAQKKAAPLKLKKISVKEPKKVQPERKRPAQQTKRLVQSENGLVSEVKLTPAPIAPLALPKPVKNPYPAPIMPLPKAAPAIANTPQVYVREQTSPAPPAQAGVSNQETGADATTSEILKRYEQLLSSWIQQHKIYPDDAKALKLQGEPVVRIRIDRRGNVRYSAIEKLSEHRLLNIAAMEMVKRANPVPAVPANYPGGDILEFLIPVSYKLR